MTRTGLPALMVVVASVLTFFIGYATGHLCGYERGAADNDAIHRRRREARLRAMVDSLPPHEPGIEP